jgi:hypothetical protein
MSENPTRMWPTMTRADASGHAQTKENPTPGQTGGTTLADAVRMWPTPTTQYAANNAGPSQYQRNSLPLNAEVGGALNPMWVEWLMGFPPHWTLVE